MKIRIPDRWWFASRLLLLVCGVLPAVPASAASALYSRPFLYWTHEAEADTANSGLDGLPTTFQNAELGLQLSLPTYTGDVFRVSLGVQARRNAVDFGGPNADRLKLYEIAVPITFDHPFSADWSARGIVTPALAGDYQDLGAKSVRGSLTGLLIRKWPASGFTLAGGAVFLPALGDNRVYPTANAVWSPSDELTLMGGLVYVPTLGKDHVSPSAGLRWRPRDDVEMMLAFPRAWIAYAPQSAVTLYANASPGGGRWRVVNAPGMNADGNFSLKEYRSGVGAAWSLVGPLRLITEAGGTWQRQYVMEPDSGPDQTTDISSTWYVTLGLALGGGLTGGLDTFEDENPLFE